MDISGFTRAGIPNVDGCEVLTRLKAFVVDQGVSTTLEHVFRDSNGNPVNLSSLFGSEGESLSSGETGT